MKTSKFKLNDFVRDKWWMDWGSGRVTKVLKTRIHVQFFNHKLVYDTGHYQFLTKETNEKRTKNKRKN